MHYQLSAHGPPKACRHSKNPMVFFPLPPSRYQAKEKEYLKKESTLWDSSNQKEWNTCKKPGTMINSRGRGWRNHKLVLKYSTCLISRIQCLWGSSEITGIAHWACEKLPCFPPCVTSWWTRRAFESAAYHNVKSMSTISSVVHSHKQKKLARKFLDGALFSSHCYTCHFNSFYY